MAFFVLSLWFQAGWFLAVAGRESYLLLTLAWVGMSYVWQWRHQSQTMLSMVAFALFGMALDQANIYFGILDFSQTWLPVWMIGLWLLFAWYGSHFVAAFAHWPKRWLCLLVATSATLSYYAGSALGAVSFESMRLSLTVLFGQWLIIAQLMTVLLMRKRE